MDKEAAQDLLERKCKEKDCWHWSARGYIYCDCCLHGVCSTIPASDRQLFLEAMKVLGRGKP